jgi:SAM-dependent methyltransferase
MWPVADPHPSWWLDETAHAGPEHLDQRYVAAYDLKSPTDWSEDVEELTALGLDQGSIVVDVGAGTGTFALAISPHVGRVIAVDVSDAMVDEMASRGITAVQAGFLSYEHTGEPADLVLSRNALHHLPDFWKTIAVERIAGMLKPGGLFVLQDLIFSFEPKDAETAIGRWLDAAPTDPARGWTAEQLAEHVRDEHSTYSWLLEPMLDRAGFDIEDRWFSESRIYGGYRCRKRRA